MPQSLAVHGPKTIGGGFCRAQPADPPRRTPSCSAGCTATHVRRIKHCMIGLHNANSRLPAKLLKARATPCNQRQKAAKLRSNLHPCSLPTAVFKHSQRNQLPHTLSQHALATLQPSGGSGCHRVHQLLSRQPQLIMQHGDGLFLLCTRICPRKQLWLIPSQVGYSSRRSAQRYELVRLLPQLCGIRAN